MIPPELERQLEAAFNTTALPPVVSFFDFAEPDQALAEVSGRPRFKSTIYIEKIARLSAVRDVFHRKMLDEDKAEYPKEWELYQSRHEAVANRCPSLMAMPGLDVASYEELKALKLTDCEKLSKYTGELHELAKFRALARRIMEISYECLREGRQEIRVEVQRPIYSISAGNTGSESGISTASAGSGVQANPNQTGSAETHPDQACNSFRYEIKVA